MLIHTLIPHLIRRSRLAQHWRESIAITSCAMEDELSDWHKLWTHMRTRLDPAYETRLEERAYRDWQVSAQPDWCFKPDWTRHSYLVWKYGATGAATAFIIDRIGSLSLVAAHTTGYAGNLLVTFSQRIEHNSHKRFAFSAGTFLSGISCIFLGLAGAPDAYQLGIRAFSSTGAYMTADAVKPDRAAKRVTLSLSFLAAGYGLAWGMGMTSGGSTLKTAALHIPWLTGTVGAFLSALPDRFSHFARASSMTTGVALAVYNSAVIFNPVFVGFGLLSMGILGKAIMRYDVPAFDAEGNTLSGWKRLNAYIKTTFSLKPQWSHGVMRADLEKLGLNQSQIAALRANEYGLNSCVLTGNIPAPVISCIARYYHSGIRESDPYGAKKIQRYLEQVFAQEPDLNPQDLKNLGAAQPTKDMWKPYTLIEDKPNPALLSGIGKLVLIQGRLDRTLPHIPADIYLSHQNRHDIGSDAILFANPASILEDGSGRRIQFTPDGMEWFMPNPSNRHKGNRIRQQALRHRWNCQKSPAASFVRHGIYVQPHSRAGGRPSPLY